MKRTFEPALLDSLEQNIREDWEGVVWRVVVGGTDPLRPNLRGARWNPPQTEALYCSMSEDLALTELETLLNRQPIPITKPRTVYKLNVRLSRVIEFRSGRELEAYGITREQLVGEEISKTRTIGNAVAWLGIAGFIVPSSRGEGHNLIVYTNCMSAEDAIDFELISTYDGIPSGN